MIDKCNDRDLLKKKERKQLITLEAKDSASTTRSNLPLKLTTKSLTGVIFVETPIRVSG